MTTHSATIFALQKKALEDSFYLFVLDAWEHADQKPLKNNWHIKVLCDRLQGVDEGECNRLCINIPPGTGKSMIVSVLWPAWRWTRNPGLQIIATTHSMRRTNKDARRMRQLIMSDWYQSRWPIGFARDQNEKLNFENQRGGSRVGEPWSQMTGARGNCLIIDDPISVDDGKSVAKRERCIETFEDAIQTRLNDLVEDSIVVIQQRVHQEDVSGWILERPDLGYEHLVIPMEYDDSNLHCPEDPRTKEGELLFPNHFPASAIKRLKAGMTPSGWAGQFQQRPSPKEAGEIDVRWFHRFARKVDDNGKTGPHCYPGMNFYMTSDHAPGGASANDWNVVRIWGVDHKRHFYLVDSFRDKCRMVTALGIQRDADGKLVAQETGALALIRKWKPLGYFPEDDNNWKTISDMFVQALRETGHYTTRIEPETPHGQNKSAKAEGFCILASNGQVHLPKGPIGDTALAEYEMFPTGKHDDQVDADSMIGRVQTKLRPGYLPLSEEDAVAGRGDYGAGASRSTSDADAFFI